MILNSKTAYGSVAKWLHWIIALLFLGSYATVKYRHWFTQKETPENWLALQLHLSIGITVGAFVFLRILWKLMNQTPALPPGPAWQHISAKAVKVLLYVVMIMMPITGYMGTGVAVDFFGLFTIPKFADTQLFTWFVENNLHLTFDEFEEPMDFLHKDVGGEFLVWMLILVHSLAAFYHHFIQKDDVLRRMLPNKNN